MNKLDFFAAVKTGDAPAVSRLLDQDPTLVAERDDAGALALHYGAIHGNREIVRMLIDKGADINGVDNEFGATPAGWAIEYIRELGGFLAIEFDDLVYAIEQQDVRWVGRILDRFPSLRTAADSHGTSFREHAEDTGNEEIINLFAPEASG